MTNLTFVEAMDKEGNRHLIQQLFKYSQKTKTIKISSKTRYK